MWLEGEKAGGTSILPHRVSFFVLYSVTQGGLKVAFVILFSTNVTESLICAGPLVPDSAQIDPVPTS